MGNKNENAASVPLNNPLGSAPVASLIRRFAIPSIISMLVSAAYNITDQIFIGQVVGMLGNAATNVAFPTVTLTTALAQLIGVGTAANFNINMGAKKPEEASRFIGTGITLLSICGPLLMIFVLLLKTPILLELYFEFAERYLRIFMMMICAYGVQPLTVNYFTGIGDAKRGIMLSLSRQGFFLIPLLIALPMIFGLDGVLYSGPIADALACALSLLLVARSFKRLTALQQSQL